MKVEISERTEQQLRKLAESRGFESVESVLAEIVATESERDPSYQADVERLLDEGRQDLVAGRYEVLSRELAGQIASEGRARLAKRGTDSKL